MYTSESEFRLSEEEEEEEDNYSSSEQEDDDDEFSSENENETVTDNKNEDDDDDNDDEETVEIGGIYQPWSGVKKVLISKEEMKKKLEKISKKKNIINRHKMISWELFVVGEISTLKYTTLFN